MKAGLSLVLVGALALTACSKGSDDSKGGGGNNKAQRLDWGSVPSEYHPQVEESIYNAASTKKIQLDLFGSDREVELAYSNEVESGTALLRRYSVWANQSFRNGISSSSSMDGTLRLSSQGEYRCAIQVRNSKITKLDGACYVRTEIVLPQNAEIEVYNLGQLISRRFFAMSAEDLVYGVDRASFSKDKFAVISNYLSSHQAIGRKPSLLSSQLGQIVDDFRFDEKLEALRQLQAYVSDRENLSKMIEDEFTYFQREEARRICGL